MNSSRYFFHFAAQRRSRMHVALVGLPGSGKTTVGRAVARYFGLDFVDTDAVIEQQLGCTIGQYFETHGENAFREVESQILERVLQNNIASLISTGGGAILRPQNRKILRAQSTVFYLKANPDDIAKRLHNDTTRPLLQGHQTATRLQELLQQRGPLYEEVAHFTLAANRKGSSQIARKMMMQIELAGILSAAWVQENGAGF